MRREWARRGAGTAEGTWTTDSGAGLDVALPVGRQAVADRVADVASSVVSKVLPILTPAEKAAFLDGYETALTLLVRGGWLAPGQADNLSRSAATAS
jgi:hypothetical protein